MITNMICVSEVKHIKSENIISNHSNRKEAIVAWLYVLSVSYFKTNTYLTDFPFFVVVVVVVVIFSWFVVVLVVVLLWLLLHRRPLLLLCARCCYRQIPRVFLRQTEVPPADADVDVFYSQLRQRVLQSMKNVNNMAAKQPYVNDIRPTELIRLAVITRTQTMSVSYTELLR